MAPKSSPTSSNARSHPTSTPIIESAHQILDGSLHLLQDTLTGADAANRFYPAAVGLSSKLLGTSVKTAPIIKVSASRPSVQHAEQSASPATSSFTSRDVGSSYSTRVASVKRTDVSPKSVHKRQLMSKNAVKMNKRESSVGKIKVSFGDAAHNIWKHIMRSSRSRNANSNRKGRRNKRRGGGKDDKWKDDRVGLGLPPSPFNESFVKGEEGIHQHQKTESIQSKTFSQPIKSEQRIANPSTKPVLPEAAAPSSTPSSLTLLSSSPSVPLYPLFVLLMIYYIYTLVFSYRYRTKVTRKVKGILGSKQFYVSQEELRGHIAKLKTRRNSGTAMNVAGGGDAAGGTLKAPESKNTGLLLHDRNCAYDEKESAVSKKLSEKMEECQRALKANQQLKEAMKLMEAECSEVNDTAQNLADKLAQTKKEKDRLKESLEKKRRLHAEVMASVSELRESLKESEAQIENLTNENIILNNVIGRLEEENNEMEKVINEACPSDNGEVDIDEIDITIISSYSGVDIESLTKEDDDVEEFARLREEKESLVYQLQQSLTENRSALDRINLQDAKVNELEQSLAQKQSELDKLSMTNQKITQKLSQLQTDYDNLKSRQPSSLQQARISTLESKVEEMQKILTRTQMDLDKKSRENADAKLNLTRVQNERDSLQQQLAVLDESIHQCSMKSRDEGTDAVLESMQAKNTKLQKTLADTESLYRAVFAEKTNMEQSIQITSDRFKSLLSEKESLQSSLRRERKRITWCNKILQDANQSVNSLMNVLQAELNRANCKCTSSDGPQSPKSQLSDGSSESKTLMHHAEILQQLLRNFEQTNQQLIAEFRRLMPDAASRFNDLLDVSTSNDIEVARDVNQTVDTAGSDSSGELHIIQSMINNAKNSKNAKMDTDMKKFNRSLENEIKATPKAKRDNTNSPTNISPTLPRALSMRRLWRKKSAP